MYGVDKGAVWCVNINGSVLNGPYYNDGSEIKARNTTLVEYDENTNIGVMKNEYIHLDRKENDTRESGYNLEGIYSVIVNQGKIDYDQDMKPIVESSCTINSLKYSADIVFEIEPEYGCGLCPTRIADEKNELLDS